MIFIQIFACILICLISLASGMIGIFFSTIITKISTQTEKHLNKTISGNNLSLYQAFGTLGNVFAVLMVSAVLDGMGTTFLNTYVWIFIGCGIISLGTMVFVKQIHL